MEIEQIKKILERYNEGQCTDEEEKAIEQWFESIHREQAVTAAGDDVPLQLEEVRQNLLAGIQASRKRNLNLRPWYYAAAAIALLIAVGAWFFQLRNRPATGSGTQETLLAGTVPGKVNRTIVNGFMIITTGKASTEQVTLEDGSTIKINAASRVRYPEHFTGNRRDIYLEEGEAYFEVAQDPQRRFTVYTDRISTTALGTAFNIRAYTSEQKITVALLNGKVNITKEQQEGNTPATELILLPSEQASYDYQSLHLVKTAFKCEDVISWQKGYLVFKEASYNEVRMEIENRYGVHIINLSNKKEWTYTGNFKQESLQNVMETICLTESLSYSIKNDTIILEDKR